MKHLFLFIHFITIIGFSQTTESRIKNFNLEKDLGIQGYDPVAYFTTNKAVKGKPEFQHNHNGIIYHFSSNNNKALFIKSPSKYEPQYGGWCAYAIGKTSEKVKINPTTFKIINNKLYLFYNAYLTNTLKLWNKNESILKANADINWNHLIKE